MGLLCPREYKIVSSLSLHRAGDLSRKHGPAAAAAAAVSAADAVDSANESSDEDEDQDDDDDMSYLLEGDWQTYIVP